MDQIQTEIEAINSQIKALRTERDALTSKEIVPENESPEKIAQAYRRQAREAAQVSAEVEGIDNAIAALKTQLKQKQRQLKSWQQGSNQPLTLEQQVEDAIQQAYTHAERINELAAELAEELQALKAIAYDLSPSYWQLHHKPFITGFRSVSVPYLRSDQDVLMLAKLII